MPQPASRDPLHYRLMEALDDLEGPTPDTTPLCNALRAVLQKLVDFERGMMPEVSKIAVARNTRMAIAHELGIGTRWPQPFEPPKVER